METVNMAYEQVPPADSWSSQGVPLRLSKKESSENRRPCRAAGFVHAPRSACAPSSPSGSGPEPRAPATKASRFALKSCSRPSAGLPAPDPDKSRSAPVGRLGRPARPEVHCLRLSYESAPAKCVLLSLTGTWSVSCEQFYGVFKLCIF